MAFIKPGSTFMPPRPGFVVAWTDPTGARRWKTCPTLEAAEELKAEKVLLEKSSPRLQPELDPAITIAQYAEHWLGAHGMSLKQRTRELYEDQLRRRILPAFGARKVRDLKRHEIKRWLAQLVTGGRGPRIHRLKNGIVRTVPLKPNQRGLTRNTVRITYMCLSTMLNHALEDQLISANPAARLGKALKLQARPKERAARIKAMDQDQLRAFLATMDGSTCRPENQRYYPFFLLLARTGLRVGEAFALMPEDLDFVRSTLRVERAFSQGRLEETPKTESSIRTVDMSPQLARILRRLLRERAERCLAKGWRAPWLFLSEVGTPYTKQNVQRVMKRMCRQAGLPKFVPHDLRHTFASLLLQRGESPQYVQQQLGHKNLSLTIDLYGRWLRAHALRGGVGGLDDSPRVATSVARGVGQGLTIDQDSVLSLPLAACQG